MNVDISWDELKAERVWFDASIGKLFIQGAEFVNGIDFNQIPDDDFESTAPVKSFSVGNRGAVIICHHKDSRETWLPIDMWLPGGFTPASRATARPRRSR